MQVISELSRYLTRHLPDRIGSYKDEYESRAFGDQFQRMGISTILIESGGYENDSEKMIPRKWNLAAYLLALCSIASETYKNEPLDAYYSLRENRKRYFDLIIRNARLKHTDSEICVDIAINKNEHLDPHRRRLVHHAVIEDIGDLDGFHGYREIDAENNYVKPGKVYIPEESVDALPPLSQLLKKGYTGIYLSHDSESLIEKWHPLTIHSSVSETDGFQLSIDKPANLRFGDEESTRFLIINGLLVDPDSVKV